MQRTPSARVLTWPEGTNYATGSCCSHLDGLIQEALLLGDVLVCGHREIAQPLAGVLHGPADPPHVCGSQATGTSSSANLVRGRAVPEAVEHPGTMSVESYPRRNVVRDFGPQRQREPRNHGCGGGGTCHSRHPASTGAEVETLQAQVRVGCGTSGRRGSNAGGYGGCEATGDDPANDKKTPTKRGMANGCNVPSVETAGTGRHLKPVRHQALHLLQGEGVKLGTGRPSQPVRHQALHLLLEVYSLAPDGI